MQKRQRQPNLIDFSTHLQSQYLPFSNSKIAQNKTKNDLINIQTQLIEKKCNQILDEDNLKDEDEKFNIGLVNSNSDEDKEFSDESTSAKLDHDFTPSAETITERILTTLKITATELQVDKLMPCFGKPKKRPFAPCYTNGKYILQIVDTPWGKRNCLLNLPNIETCEDDNCYYEEHFFDLLRKQNSCWTSVPFDYYKCLSRESQFIRFNAITLIADALQERGVQEDASFFRSISLMDFIISHGLLGECNDNKSKSDFDLNNQSLPNLVAKGPFTQKVKGIPEGKLMAAFAGACACVASKFESRLALKPKHIASWYDCQLDDVYQIERHILFILNFHFTHPTCFDFLKLLLQSSSIKIDLSAKEIETFFYLALYLSELSLFDIAMLKYQPLVTARAAIFVSMKMMGIEYINTLDTPISHNMISTSEVYDLLQALRCWGNPNFRWSRNVITEKFHAEKCHNVHSLFLECASTSDSPSTNGRSGTLQRLLEECETHIVSTN